MSTEQDRLSRYGNVIWTTSRNDEDTISVTGANIVARAVMAVADEEMATLSRAVLTWAERFTAGDRWDSEDLRDLETALSGTVEAHPTAHWRREMADLRAELEMFKRGGKTLGDTIEWQCRAVLDATGLHHLIGEDGDGDWALVWEHLAELRPRAEKAEAEVARLLGGDK